MAPSWAVIGADLGKRGAHAGDNLGAELVETGTHIIVSAPLIFHCQVVLTKAARRLRHAGFVHGAELADNVLFAISAAEAGAMDPSQRLVLEHGYGALHDARIEQQLKLGGTFMGVFLGFAGMEFAQVLLMSPLRSSVYSASGSTASIASGRLSYALGLHGPSVSYDTACSATLVAE